MRSAPTTALIALLIALGGPSAARGEEPPCLEWGEVIAEDRGIGGTGLSDDSGIGGTGLDPDSGIGGTGLYGTITGFGSVCINGIRVHIGDAPVIDINGAPASEDDLAVGLVVWIEARAHAGRLEAERIAAQSAVVGAIEVIDLAARELEVDGERILVPASALIVDAQGLAQEGLAELFEGEIVGVSGLRLPDGRIEASRVERGAAAPLAAPTPLPDLLRAAPWIDRVSLEGHLSPLAATDWVEVNGLPVDATTLVLDHAAAGAVWMLGDVVDGQVQARRVTRRSTWRGSRNPAPPRHVEAPLAASDRPDLFLPHAGDRGGDPDNPPAPKRGGRGAWTPTPVPRPQAPPPPSPLPRPEPIPIDQGGGGSLKTLSP